MAEKKGAEDRRKARVRRAIRKAAAWLLVPYIAWLCFATFLNFQIDQRNPDAENKGVVVPAATTQIG